MGKNAEWRISDGIAKGALQCTVLARKSVFMKVLQFKIGSFRIRCEPHLNKRTSGLFTIDIAQIELTRGRLNQPSKSTDEIYRIYKKEEDGNDYDLEEYRVSQRNRSSQMMNGN